MTTTSNHETVQGLRALADFLEAHPDLDPFPYGETMLYPILGGDPKQVMADWARAARGLARDKNYDGTYAMLTIEFSERIRVQVYASREQVCEKVVTGTREVTKSVKDPDALAAVPTVEVTETVEDVEWICRPLLAADELAEATS